MSVPIYYLRKPIYLLLQHAKENGSKYDKYLYEIIYKYVIKSNPGAICMADDEIVFSKEQRILFESKYELNKKSRFITKFWLLVHNYWAKRKDDKEDDISVNVFGDNAPEALKKFGIMKSDKSDPLQNKVYKKLVDYEESNANGNLFLVDKELAEQVCYLAKMALFELKSDENDKDVLDKMLKLIEEDVLNKNKQENIVDEHRKFWKTGRELGKEIPDVFHLSDWVCYERTDGRVSSAATWGVALSKVRIEQPDTEGYIPITLHSEYVSGNYTHAGVVTIDKSSGYLVAHLTREITHKNQKLQTSAFFIMRLNHMMPEAHGLPDGLLLGHFSYYSVYYGSFLTKAVIWIKASYSLAQEVFSELPKDLANNDSRFNKYVPQFVRTFLYNRLRNRLTMPSSNLMNADENDWRHSIQQWLSDKNRSIEQDYVLKLCRGEYFVCYYYGDIISDKNKVTEENIAQFIRVDELCITYNEDSADFEVKYTHNREAVKEQSQSNILKAGYRGVARRRNSTVQVILNESSETTNTGSLIEETAAANYIYLAFCAPMVHKVAEAEFERHEYFPGIIAGLNDSNDGPIALRMVVVRKDKILKKNELAEQREFNFLEYRDNNVAHRIERYFKLNINSRSIKVEAQSNRFIDLYPNLEELRLVGGTYEISCSGGKYILTGSYKTETLKLEGEDINRLLSKADELVLSWKLYSL